MKTETKRCHSTAAQLEVRRVSCVCGLPGVVTGNVVKEGLGLVVVTVGAKWVALVVGVALAVLSLHAGVAFVLAV